MDAVAAGSDQILEDAVDALLASPAFGERWASLWLDLARYADTQGYEKDRHRDIWLFRDWVIRAFNADMPYNEFTLKQLAGDMLKKGTLEDHIATAFHRNTQTNTEGGTDDEEFRVAAVVDRVNTTWTVWQGLTFGCTQCHDHPYDPIRHEEYYKFMAFFNNTEDHDLNDDYPRLQIPADPAHHVRAAMIDQRLKALRQSRNEPGRRLERATRWRDYHVEKITGAPSVKFEVTKNDVVVSGTVPFRSAYDVTLPARDFTALRIDIRPRTADQQKVPEHGSVLSHLTAEIVDAAGKARPLTFQTVFARTLSGPFDPDDTLQDNAAGGGAHPKIDRANWLVFVPEKAVKIPEGEKLRLRLKHGIGSNETKGSVLKRFRFAYASDAKWTRLGASPRDAALKRQATILKEQRKKLGGATVPVMRERPPTNTRRTRLFIRGNFRDRGRLVPPGIPSVFPQIATDAILENPLGAALFENPLTRLDAAEWVVDPRNPLTARVFVNRVWAELFGIGLVETLEDFGSTGTRPSHPELLDYLALRFTNEHQWRLKPFLKELVLSAAYRRDYKSTPEIRDRDPRNRLLARGPRTRLTAEMVRDQALRSSGLLTEKLGGPSVMPPQPDGVWSVVYNGARWKTAEGPDRYRRALYTYWRRTSPYPSFLTFDASSREVCQPRRLPTNTPLQALVTLNDPVYLECAQALAKSAANQDPAELVSNLCLKVTSKKPSDNTTKHLVALFEDAVEIFTVEPEEQKHLGATPQEAAAVIVANAVLNLDTSLTK